MGYPYVFRCLSAVTPKKYLIEIVDERFDKINFNKNYDIVGITTYTANAFHAYEIADKFREKGVKVVLGGYHASALPDEAKQHADSVVIGEAEETWPQLLKDFEKGKLKPFYRQTRPVDLSTIPLYDATFIGERSIRNVIQTSRGCPNGCEFCAITNSEFGRRYRTRPIDHVLKELITVPQKNIFFLDPSLTTNVNRTKLLFKKLRNLNKKFLCNGTVNVLSKDDELLRLASEAGCVEWFVGFESLSQENINAIGKRTNVVKEYKIAVKKIHDHGMLVTASFIFGFDGDTKNVFSETLDAAYDMEVDSAGFHILTPYPGTPLFERLEREGRILTKDWSRYRELDSVVFQPKNMTPYELLDGTQYVKKEFFSFNNVVIRSLKTMKIGMYPFIQNALVKNLP